MPISVSMGDISNSMTDKRKIKYIIFRDYLNTQPGNILEYTGMSHEYVAN